MTMERIGPRLEWLPFTDEADWDFEDFKAIVEFFREMDMKSNATGRPTLDFSVGASDFLKARRPSSWRRDG
jgi:hypothetical protein